MELRREPSGAARSSFFFRIPRSKHIICIIIIIIIIIAIIIWLLLLSIHLDQQVLLFTMLLDLRIHPSCAIRSSHAEPKAKGARSAFQTAGCFLLLGPWTWTERKRSRILPLFLPIWEYQTAGLHTHGLEVLGNQCDLGHLCHTAIGKCPKPYSIFGCFVFADTQGRSAAVGTPMFFFGPEWSGSQGSSEAARSASPAVGPSLVANADQSASLARLGKGQMGSALMGSLQFLFDRGTFLVHPLIYFYLPKSARAYLFSQSVKIHYSCSGPISVDPMCPQPTCAPEREPPGADGAAGEEICIYVIYIYIYTYIYIHTYIIIIQYTIAELARRAAKLLRRRARDDGTLSPALAC